MVGLGWVRARDKVRNRIRDKIMIRVRVKETTHTEEDNLRKQGS